MQALIRLPLINNSKDDKKQSLVNRMLEKNANYIVEGASLLGLGNRNYELIIIDE